MTILAGGRFVLPDGGAKPRPEEERNAAGGSKGVDAVKLGFKKLIRCPVAQNLSGKRVGPVCHVGDVLCREPLHADAFWNEPAKQFVVAFVRPFFPG